MSAPMSANTKRNRYQVKPFINGTFGVTDQQCAWLKMIAGGMTESQASTFADQMNTQHRQERRLPVPK